MDSWKIFNKTLLNTENVYITLNIESISNSDKKNHAVIFWNTFKMSISFNLCF